jgi:hypothetical protein
LSVARLPAMKIDAESPDFFAMHIMPGVDPKSFSISP